MLIRRTVAEQGVAGDQPTIHADRGRAGRHCPDFFAWYNDRHRDTGLGPHAAADVRDGPAEAVRDKRAGVLDAGYVARPERFVRKPPQPPTPPSTAWVNRPGQPEEQAQ